MKKTFILIVSYGTGEIAMLTKEPDLLKAIEEFEDKMRKDFKQDKGSLIPYIISAKILPVVHDSVYGE